MILKNVFRLQNKNKFAKHTYLITELYIMIPLEEQRLWEFQQIKI